jgi:PPK2 family polyphosphate:nucleotide phosphotransferase
MPRYRSSMLMSIKEFHVKPNQKVRLADLDPEDTSNLDLKKGEAHDEIAKLKKRLEELQEKLFAERRHKILIVLQAMDTGGKDSTIRLVFEGVNPQGVRVVGFKQPTPEEKAHDFLWRVHKVVPQAGEIAIFNRSHYEGVLIERVHKIVPKSVWEKRYDEINNFERTLSDEGTLILKFYLHISKAEQKKRLEERLKDPTKEWKFSISDLPERKFWKEYMIAYQDALEKTSTSWAPWYLVPSNHKWFRDYIVANAIVNHMEQLEMHYPKLDEATKKESMRRLAV